MSRKTILRNLGKIFGIGALLAFATPTVFADNPSKTFKFGPGNIWKLRRGIFGILEMTRHLAAKKVHNDC